MTSNASKNIADKLSKNAIGKGLSEEELISLAALFVARSLPPEIVVFDEGETGDGLYLVLQGSVRVEKHNAAGGYSEVAVLDQGSLFGEISLITGAPRSGRIKMAVDGTLACLSREKFKALAENDVKLHTKLTQGLGALACDRLSKTTLKVAQMLHHLKMTSDDVDELSKKVSSTKQSILGFVKHLMFGWDGL